MLEYYGAAREQIAIVEAFLEDDLGTQNAMSLIVIVHHEQLVCLVLIQRQLAEYMVPLNVSRWETDRILNVALLVILDGPQVEQDDLRVGRLRGRLLRGELAGP